VRSCTVIDLEYLLGCLIEIFTIFGCLKAGSSQEYLGIEKRLKLLDLEANGRL